MDQRIDEFMRRVLYFVLLKCLDQGFSTYGMRTLKGTRTISGGTWQVTRQPNLHGYLLENGQRRVQKILFLLKRVQGLKKVENPWLRSLRLSQSVGIKQYSISRARHQLTTGAGERRDQQPTSQSAHRGYTIYINKSLWSQKDHLHNIQGVSKK